MHGAWLHSQVVKHLSTTIQTKRFKSHVVIIEGVVVSCCPVPSPEKLGKLGAWVPGSSLEIYFQIALVSITVKTI